MSRHKLVKNLDLDTELAVFDGGEENSEEDNDYGTFPYNVIYGYVTNVWGYLEISEEDKGPSLLPSVSQCRRSETDSDTENLRLGTIQVRENLPEGPNRITDKQIQDSLWHYYYDVDKTVSYLVKKYMTKPKEKKLTGGSQFCSQTHMGTHGRRVGWDEHRSRGGF